MKYEWAWKYLPLLLEWERENFMDCMTGSIVLVNSKSSCISDCHWSGDCDYAMQCILIKNDSYLKIWMWGVRSNKSEIYTFWLVPLYSKIKPGACPAS